VGELVGDEAVEVHGVELELAGAGGASDRLCDEKRAMGRWRYDHGVLYTYGMRPQDPLRVNRGVISIGRLHDQPDDKAFWLKRSPVARLEAIELMRQTVYGYDPATLRLQRVLAVTRLQRD